VFVLLLFGVCAVDGYRRKRQEVRKQDSEGVPYEVTNAIRTAKSNAKKALEEAEAREDEMNAAKAEAEQAAAVKAQADKDSDAAARDASAKSQQANDQAKAKAKAAAAAVESKEDWNNAVQTHQQAADALQAATDAFNNKKAAVAERIRELNKNLAEKEQAMKDAEAAEKAAEQEAAEKRIEYEAAQATENAEVKALAEALEKVKAANKVSSDKAAAAKVAGREAEAAQNALDDAVAALEAAKQVVAEKKAMKNKLWDLYDRIEEFYDASSKLVKAMRRSEDECSDAPHQCLVSDGPGGGREHLRPVLEGYNIMVLAFDEISQLYPDIYGEIAVAGTEIETNAMGQVHLVCDPYRSLEGSSSLAFHAAASTRSELQTEAQALESSLEKKGNPPPPQGRRHIGTRDNLHGGGCFGK